LLYPDWWDGMRMGAVEAAGAENVDAIALKEALTATNMDVEGFGNTWNLDRGMFFN